MISGLLLVVIAFVILDVILHKTYAHKTSPTQLVIEIVCFIIAAIGGYFIYQGKIIQKGKRKNQFKA
jgi:hypothetical protein